MILISLVISIGYAFLILSLIVGFDRVKPFNPEEHEEPTRFTILIPFRNEAKNLPRLLKSLHSLNYSSAHFEVLLIDDDSEDNSVEIIEEFQKKSTLKLTILKNERRTQSPKKDAITHGVRHAKNNWILTTDADCIVPEKWLLCYNSFIQAHEANVICGAVNFVTTNSFLDRFQQLELLSLMSATLGGFGLKKPFMCNGANLCYRKHIFEDLNGFDGNSNIASGDDIFLLEKALEKEASKVYFLKSHEAVVLTKPAASYSAMVQQRVRWASKSTHYRNAFGKLTGLIIFAMNGLVVSLLLLCLFKLIPFRIFLYCFVLKFYCDFWLILKSATFFNSRKSLPSYLLSSFLYPFLTLFIVYKSLFFTYKWKGRHFNK